MFYCLHVDVSGLKGYIACTRFFENFKLPFTFELAREFDVNSESNERFKT